MPRDTPTAAQTPIAFVQAIVAAYTARGLDAADALHKARIAPTDLALPAARVSPAQFERLCAAAMHELDDEAPGWFSRPLPWGSYGMLARASHGASTLGVALNEHGMPELNPHSMQVGDLPVYLAGDANNQHPLLHEAVDEGHMAGINAMADAPKCFQRRTPLAIVFSDPDAAVVGKGFAALQKQAKEEDGPPFVTGAVNFARQGRARAGQRNDGRLCVYADQVTGRLLGAELCTPAGEHLAHLLALAIGQEMTVTGLLGMPFYHPVLEEGLRTALRDAARQLDVQAGSDLAGCEAIGAPALE